MKPTIKAGIIGTGFIGPAHVEAARRLGNVEFMAVAEANQELAKQSAEAMCDSQGLRQLPRAVGRPRDPGRAQLHTQPSPFRGE